jgi:hypothetical protein
MPSAVLMRRMGTGPCVDPGVLTLAISTLTSTTITFTVGMPSPGPKLGSIIRWGTTLGGPYPNSKSFGTGATVQVSTADGLVADTQYYFVAYGNNGNGCISVTPSTELAAGLANATMTDWVARIVAIFGAVPSANTQNASNNYLIDLIAAGINTKIKVSNLLVPDSVAAFATPLIKGTGFDSWTDPGAAWVPADGNVNGWKNTGLRSLNTGFKPADFMTASSSYGFVYVSVGDQATNQEEWGVDDGTGVKDYRMAFQWSDHTSFTYCYGTGATDFVQGTVNGVATIAGYMACSRTANNAMNLYFANSTTPHFSVASNVNVNAHTPTNAHNMFVYGTNDNESLILRSNKRLSAVGWGTGLTSAESLAHYNAVTKARIRMGGGTV